MKTRFIRHAYTHLQSPSPYHREGSIDPTADGVVGVDMNREANVSPTLNDYRSPFGHEESENASGPRGGKEENGFIKDTKADKSCRVASSPLYSVSPRPSSVFTPVPMHLNGMQKRRSVAFAPVDGGHEAVKSGGSIARGQFKAGAGEQLTDEGRDVHDSYDDDYDDHEGNRGRRMSVSTRGINVTHDEALSPTKPKEEYIVADGRDNDKKQSKSSSPERCHGRPVPNANRRLLPAKRKIEASTQGNTARGEDTCAKGEWGANRNNNNNNTSPSPSRAAKATLNNSQSPSPRRVPQPPPRPSSPSATSNVATAVSTSISAAAKPLGQAPGEGISDEISSELLNLVRTFRQSVEKAIVEGEGQAEVRRTVFPAYQNNNASVSPASGLSSAPSHVPPNPSTGSSALVIPRYVGAELNQACNDIIRYVTQYVRHKKDEFDELLVRRVRWNQPAAPEDMAALAEKEGPAHLTSLYALVESLMTVAQCDRAILYAYNPQTQLLVGIVYGGTSVPIQIPVTVRLKVTIEESRTGGPPKRTIHPAAVSFLNAVGLNILSLSECPPEIAVESYAPLSGYTTRNTLCVPVGGGDLGVRREVGGVAESHELSSNNTGHQRPIHLDEDAEPLSASRVVGVLQLINKLHTAPLRTSRGEAQQTHIPTKTAAGGGGAGGGGAIGFTPADEAAAASTARQIATILRWASSAQVDFFSTKARQYSAHLQHMHANIRARERGLGEAMKQILADPTKVVTSSPLKQQREHISPVDVGQPNEHVPQRALSAHKNVRSFAGGAARLTHTEDAVSRALQTRIALRAKREVRDGLCGDVLEAVEAVVAKAAVEEEEARTLKARSRVVASSASPVGSAVRGRPSASRSPSPRRATDLTNVQSQRGIDTALAKVQALTDKMFGGNPNHGNTSTATEQSNTEAKKATGGTTSAVSTLVYTTRGGVIDNSAPLVMHRVTDKKSIKILEDQDINSYSTSASRRRLSFSQAPDVSRDKDTEGSETFPSTGQGLRLMAIRGSSGGGRDELDPPSVLEATQAYAMMRAAWRSAHAQLLDVTERLAAMNLPPEQEKAGRAGVGYGST